jgi:Zn-dependent protease
VQLFNGPGTNPAARNETLEFAKAWIGTALAFAVLFSGGRIASPRFFTLLVLAALTAGVGVILHEVAHRVVARHFGATAHFVANDGMLILSILIAFAGFLFAAPGAVWHSGYLTKRQVGLVAAAGPATNMVLAIVFAVLFLALRDSATPLVVSGLGMGFLINALLGAFNMLPLGPIDGAKILNWNVVAFGALFAVAAAIAFGLPRVFEGLPRLF